MHRRVRLLSRHAGLIAEALVTVLRVRIDLSLRRKGKIVPLLRRHAKMASDLADGGQVFPAGGANGSRPVSYQVAAPVWAVRHAARLVPGASCLTQALSGQTLLARRNLESVVRIGVRRGRNDAFEAHAWLICEGQTVLGQEHEPGPDFVPLSDLSPAGR